MRRYVLPPINLTGPKYIPSDTDVYRNICSNAQHPKGAWHNAAPALRPWQLLTRFRQWRNTKKWGCWCP